MGNLHAIRAPPAARVVALRSDRVVVAWLFAESTPDLGANPREVAEASGLPRLRALLSVSNSAKVSTIEFIDAAGIGWVSVSLTKQFVERLGREPGLRAD